MVLAINATTVGVLFNQAVSADDGLSFTFQGAPVAAGNVAYDGSMAHLTVPTMVHGNEYTVTITDGDELDETFTFTYDITEPAVIAHEIPLYTQQVGLDVNVKYTVLDDQGDPVEGADVFVRARDAGFPALDDVTQTLTTDADGEITFSYSRSEPIFERLTAYVVDKPTVRNIMVRVEWDTAPIGLVSVHPQDSQTLGLDTHRDFTITIKDEDGTPRTEENLLIDFDLGIPEADYNLYIRDLSVADPEAANAWVASGAGGLARVGATTRYQVTLNDSGAGQNVTADGVVQIRVVGQNAGVYTPLFYYNAANSVAAPTIADPNAVGGQTGFVEQVPQITLTPADDQTLMATAAGEIGTDEEKNANFHKGYTLEVTDQFGNPFRGDFKVADWRLVNGIALPEQNSANVSFDQDLNQDGTFTVGAQAFGANIHTITNAYDATTAYANIDGKRDLIVYGTNAAQTFRLAVWVDADLDDIIDANEESALGEQLTFAARALETVNVEEVPGPQIAQGGNLYYEAALYDQFEDPMRPGTMMDAIIVDENLVREANNNRFSIALNNTAAAADPTYGVAITQGTPVARDLGNVDDNIVKAKVDVNVHGTHDHDKVWSFVVFESDAGADYAGTEVADSSEFQTTPGVYDSAKLTLSDPSTNVGLEESDVDGVWFGLNTEAAPTNRLVRHTYQLVDDGGQDFDPAVEPTATVTVVNTGNAAVTVKVGTDPDATLAAGATGVYEHATATGELVVDITSAEGAKSKVDVTVSADGFADSEVSSTLYFANKLADATDNAYNGPIVAVETSTGAGNAANTFVMNTTLGYIVVPYADAGVFGGTILYRVDGSVATTAAILENYLEIGYGAQVVTTAGGDITVDITTN